MRATATLHPDCPDDNCDASAPIDDDASFEALQLSAPREFSSLDSCEDVPLGCTFIPGPPGLRTLRAAIHTDRSQGAAGQHCTPGSSWEQGFAEARRRFNVEVTDVCDGPERWCS